ncbi:MAG TPA: hypothetical protein VET27_12010 [Mycobacterium sp.]|nr:hypothetical protein [Mycobacterium sp.]
MRRGPNLAPSVRLIMCSAALGVAAFAGAPAASAGCNDSSGTVVCAQGDIRGTHAAPPARADLGAWGYWCNGSVCFSGGRFGIGLGP